MRKIKCHDIPGIHVGEILDEFNERPEEFGIEDEDIISISSSAPAFPVKVIVGKETKEAAVRVSIFYWSDE